MEEIERELELHRADWKALLAEGRASELLEAVVPMQAHWTLRPFLETYAVVAETLEGAADTNDEKELISRALGLGKQYVLQNRHLHPESVSTALFKSALSLADNRGLVTGDDLTEARAAFHAEVADVLARTARIAEIAHDRSH